ncbi:MAG: aldo/keto reductase [Pseudomonadaceae bacterium]|nr:aldo/keto reductase [Pseudomonadaceae bacterium]
MSLRWGILATGTIGKTFAKALNAKALNAKALIGTAEHELVAVGSRSAAGAQAFAEVFPDLELTCHNSYDGLINDPQVDAIYVSTPHTEHAAWAIRAMQAGKHVLCEKPMGLNHAECMAMVTCAARHNVFLMEAFMYRLHPQMLAIVEAVRSGEIGEVRHIEAQFGYHANFDGDSRLFANHLAGGGIMDVGCYPLSFARAIAGSEPVDITAHGKLGRTGVDEWSTALLKFEDGLAAQISTAVSLNLDNTAIIYGSKGSIHVPKPWLPLDEAQNWSFNIQRGADIEVISGHSEGLYKIEADHVAQHIAAGNTQSDILTWQESLNNALALDQWRKAIGLSFDIEQPQSHRGPLLGALSKPDNRISKGSVNHLDKPVARLVMGCDNQPSMSHASVMWDDYFEAGGNCFDTAYIYGGGSMESLLGHWHTARGIRDEIVIIGKGAHTPDNFPHIISKELDVSLQRLQSNYVDIYFLHRDNLDVPVAEFVDALNDEVKAGRIRTFGGSNWSVERVKEANDYAASKGLQGFSAVSNNFSLAQMNEPIWPGTEDATSDAYRTYLQDTQIALMPWSSQARGFFTPWAGQVIAEQGKENLVVTSVQPTIEELKRVWFSQDNFTRRDRAGELAEKYGVEMINIALAYVLSQPFPTFPLIGPRQLQETDSCIESLHIDLTQADIDYLNLR